MQAFINGLLTSLGMIIAIGAQNSYVLKKGLIKKDVFTVSLICCLCDLILIFIGIYGASWIKKTIPILEPVFLYGGCLFLLVYGLLSFKSAFSNSVLTVDMQDSSDDDKGLRHTILITLAITLLNPHVYIDTLFVLGSIGSRYNNEAKLLFGLGCAISSFSWFFSLGYGSRFLAPLFEKKYTWKVLDIVIGIVMISIAITLLLSIP